VLDVNIQRFRDRYNRYDVVQCNLFGHINNSFENWKSGNWIIQWDDDIFWFNEDLKTIRKTLETTNYDKIKFKQHKFTYNFRFGSWTTGGIPFDRITDGCYYTPIANLHYKDGGLYSRNEKQIDIVTYHYTLIKRPERMDARQVMSIEKGTSASIGRFKKWMEIKWENDEEFLKNKKDVAYTLGVNPDDVHVYYGKHPEILDDHPWRYIEDIRRIK